MISLNIRGHRALPWILIGLLAAAGCGRGENGAKDDKSSTGRAAGAGTAATPADSAASLDLGPRAVETMALIEPLAATGQMLFDAKGCTGCHEMGVSENAPDLRGVAAIRTEAWLRRQIAEPEWMAAYDPLTRAMVEKYGIPMADLDVTPDETTALLQYLLRESGQSLPPR